MVPASRGRETDFPVPKPQTLRWLNSFSKIPKESLSQIWFIGKIVASPVSEKSLVVWLEHIFFEIIFEDASASEYNRWTSSTSSGKKISPTLSLAYEQC